MSDRKRMTTERLTGLISNPKVPVWELDQAFWARERGVDYPLTHYDLDHWEGCVREGEPAARAVSDPGALLRHVELRYPGHRLDLRAENGRARVRLLLTGQPVGVEGEFEGDTPLSDLGRAVAAAFLRADDLASSLQQRLLGVSGLNPPPYQDWPIEEISPGRWGAVHHELRLLCATANGPDGAARHAGMNHEGDHGVLLCRERYERAFGDPEADLVWMVGTRDSVLRDAYTAGPDNAPDLLKLGMREGEILIGKDRRGEVRVVREMGPDGCVDLPGGLDALRADDAPEP
jgi:hypothetical protein